MRCLGGEQCEIFACNPAPGAEHPWSAASRLRALKSFLRVNIGTDADMDSFSP